MAVSISMYNFLLNTVPSWCLGSSSGHSVFILWVRINKIPFFFVVFPKAKKILIPPSCWGFTGHRWFLPGAVWAALVCNSCYFLSLHRFREWSSDKHTSLLCQLCLPVLTSQQGHWVKFEGGFIIHVKLESFLKIRGWASPSLSQPEVTTRVWTSCRVTLLPSEVLCDSPDSPLQGSTACRAEVREWHREVLGFLTPKVFLCTDCHFIGRGSLKSPSWCLSSLLGDTGSPRVLCSLWFLLSEVFVLRKRIKFVVAAAGSFTSVTRSQDTFQHLGKTFFFFHVFL